MKILFHDNWGHAVTAKYGMDNSYSSYFQVVDIALM